jgi:putative addiction module CopG family antidote
MPYSLYTFSEEKAMPTRNVSLPEALDRFVEDTIKTGRYDNASEVVRSALRLLQEEERVNQEKFASGVAPDGSRERMHEYIKGRVSEKEGRTECSATT